MLEERYTSERGRSFRRCEKHCDTSWYRREQCAPLTSPPYLEVIKYGLYNWIRLWWLIGDYKHVDEKLDDTHS